MAESNLIESDAKMYVALITAGLALLGTISGLVWQWWLNRKTAVQQQVLETLKADLTTVREKDVEREKARLSTRMSVEEARRDYIYEGRKRLYSEYEPIAFQMVEAGIHAAWRVQSLARSSRRGDISVDGSGWLEDPLDYYLLVTVYDLLVPAATYRVLRRTLTSVDFSLDQRIRWEYSICKQAFLAFTNAFELASGIDPKLPYSPDTPDWKNLRESDPSRYWRQGLAVGRLEALLEAMTVAEKDGSRVMNYGEFENRYLADPQGELRVRADVAVDVIRGFHPVSRPVLWRVLLYQVVLYHALAHSALQSQDSKYQVGKVPPLLDSVVKKYIVSTDGDDSHGPLLEQLTERVRRDLEMAMTI